MILHEHVYVYISIFIIWVYITGILVILVRFNGLSTIDSYFIRDPIYIYIYIYICVCVCVCVCVGCWTKILKNFKTFFVWLVQFLKESKFLLWALLFKQFFVITQLNIRKQEKKQQRKYNLLYAETKPKMISKIIGLSLWPPLSTVHDLLGYAIWSVLENKTNTTSHPNIGSFKAATEEE